jgi:5-methylcytosine-specific restriction endonuclease McrA
MLDRTLCHSPKGASRYRVPRPCIEAGCTELAQRSDRCIKHYGRYQIGRARVQMAQSGDSGSVRGFRQPVGPRECEHCGVTYLGTSGRRFCSPECGRVCHRRMNRDRRRAIRADNSAGRILRLRVFERDRWVCQVCGRPVDPEAAYPDPLMASLDHRVPLRLGGDHSETNVQLAHLACNLSKGASVVAGAIHAGG